MTTLQMQQVPPQPVPGDMPPPGPGTPPPPVVDPTQDPPPPIEDPDVIDPTPGPDAPMIARKADEARDRPEPAAKGRVEA